MQHLSTKFARSHVLVLGFDCVTSLLPSTLIYQVEALLQAHRIQDAVDIADAQRIQSGASNGDETEELHYVYQCIGWQCFRETLFDDAGRHLFAGMLDPRVLLSYFPDMCGGALFDHASAHAVDVFAGVAAHMPPEPSVEDVINNYSPHLAPSTLTALPTAELRRILSTAHDMLEHYLRRWRAGRRNAITMATTNANTEERRPPDGTLLQQAVDTALLKLYTTRHQTAPLLTLLASVHAVSLVDAEPALQRAGQYAALAMLYRQQHGNGHARALLGLWAKLADGDWIDSGGGDVPDPLGEMLAYLGASRDRALLAEWVGWLAKRDPGRTLKLLTARDAPTKRSGTRGAARDAEDDAAMLRLLSDTDADSGAQFLEWLVLQKRSPAPELHGQLAMSCVERVLAHLVDPGVSKLWRAKATSYASMTNTTTPFFSYFASTTPDAAHKRARVQCALVLQGSQAYDAQKVYARLVAATTPVSPVEGLEGQAQGQAHLPMRVHRRTLALELAIVLSKLGRHREVLTTLVYDLKDTITAEAYCALTVNCKSENGEAEGETPRVVSAALAYAVARSCGLQAWASALFSSPVVAVPPSTTMAMWRNPVTAFASRTPGQMKRKTLLDMLLDVYICDPEVSVERTSRLLNAHAVSLDVVDVISLVPSEWPVQKLSGFMCRSFRRTLHARHEAQIMKAISVGQNLAVAEHTWAVVREFGAMVEEVISEDGNDVIDEKVIEKVMEMEEKNHL